MVSCGVKKGHVHSVVTKERMSNAHKGKVLSEEHKANIRKNWVERRKKYGVNGRSSPIESGTEFLTAMQRYAATDKGRASIKKSKQAYRARKRINGVLLIDTVKLVYDDNIIKYGILTCIYCLSAITNEQATLEHILPLSRGGDNQQCNLAIACYHCNCVKNNKTQEEYRNYLKG